MNVSSYSKKHKLIATVILAPMLFLIVCLMLVACDPDIKYDEAIAIAKKDFGVEKVLWVAYTPALALSKDGPRVIGAWHYANCIVGEKDGEEIFIVIPSPQTEESFIATWNLDYTFKQIVEEFNKLGAEYIIDVPDDYYSKRHDSYIDIVVKENNVNRLAEFYEVDEPETFYERLDVKVVFTYRRLDDGIIHDYMVTQIDGKLVSCEQTYSNS